MRKYLNKMKAILMACSSATLLLTGCNKEEKVLEKPFPIESFAQNIPLDELKKPNQELKPNQQLKMKEKTIVISTVGNCNLGTDTDFIYNRSFPYVLEENNQDYGYFFDGVDEILENDDLTIANLATTFTTSRSEITNKLNYKGEPEYSSILTEGSVEVVNLANDHTYDYGETGYTDTISSLENAGVMYFGYDNYCIKDVEGIKIGMAGIKGWNEDAAKKNTNKAIQFFKNNHVDLIIITYQWEMENENMLNSKQTNIARYAIDMGADYVVGYQQSGLQEIEYYNGKYIIYSLGNFILGENKNPEDMNTVIAQQSFHFKNGILTGNTLNLIPCRISGSKDFNNYQPVPLSGDESEIILEKYKIRTKI